MYLPTEAEWEKAARGGASGHRFPWSDADTITHSRANYKSYSDVLYDVSPTREYHPTYATDDFPWTSSVGSFAANGYGPYDMAGNVWEWCLDRWGDNLPGGKVENPHGPDIEATRVVRGGCWYNSARICRSSYRAKGNPAYRGNETGFRVVLARGV